MTTAMPVVTPVGVPVPVEVALRVMRVALWHNECHSVHMHGAHAYWGIAQSLSVPLARVLDPVTVFDQRTAWHT